MYIYVYMHCPKNEEFQNSSVLSCLQLLTDTASSGGSPSFLIGVYQKLFGSQAHPAIIRYNDFSDIAAYFVQKVHSTSDVFPFYAPEYLFVRKVVGEMFFSPPSPSLSQLNISWFFCPCRPSPCA